MVSIHSSLYTKESGGTMSRFKGHSAHADRDQAALRADHPASTEGRSLFQKSVVDASKSPRLLISGVNSPKIGSRITKGPWQGLKVFTFALEERATCPASCWLWRECYGNAMPLARRHRDDGTLILGLKKELRALADKFGSFAVRLHVLGDFIDEMYVAAWWRFLRVFPGLRIWGYTAHPIASDIGERVHAMNAKFAGRCVIRYSVEHASPTQTLEATTIWRKPEADVVPEGQVCPVSSGKTDTCGTCGLCWAPEMRDKRIVFVGHGMRRRTGKRKVTILDSSAKHEITPSPDAGPARLA